MALEQLEAILKFFTGAEMTGEEKDRLFCETMLMTLARASASDTNISDIEVGKVQEIIKRETGRDVEAKSVRVEAIQHAFETAPFDRLLRKVRSSLGEDKRIAIADALAELIQADGRVSAFEIDFFNKVVVSLDLRASDVKQIRE